MRYLIVAVIISFMSVSYGQNYDEYLDEKVDYNECLESDILHFSGAPDVICEEPEYEPCQTEFSGSACEDPDEETCAIFITDTGNLHITNVYADGAGINAPYVRMVHDDGVFTVEEIIIE